MTQRVPVLAFLCVALVGCATKKPAADSSAALAPPDTMKPAPVAMQAADTTKAGATIGAKKTSSKSTKKRAASKTASKQTKDTHLGRDSVIKFDPRDPRRQLPTIPPKKPPEER